MWYAVIGTLICITIGVIVGYLTNKEADKFDERLLHPLVAKIARHFPGSSHTFSTPDRDRTPEENEASDKTCDTIIEDPKSHSGLASNKIYYIDSIEPIKTRL